MNKQDLPVRHLVIGGPAKASADRRIRRTTDALVTALIELVHARRYDAITIQDLLDHANVGRSTFYSHYRGKDDFLLRSFERMLASLDAGIDNDKGNVVRIAPVRELFAHIGQMRGFLHSLERAHKLDRVLQVGAVQLSATIARRLAARAGTPDGVPPAARAQALAGALFALLRWWLDQDKPESPEHMDAMFHAICLGTPRGAR